MKAEAQKDVDLFQNRGVIDEALKRGVRKAMLRHKNEGSFVVVERDGKIEWLKPEDLGFWRNSADRRRVQSGARRYGMTGEVTGSQFALWLLAGPRFSSGHTRRTVYAQVLGGRSWPAANRISQSSQVQGVDFWPRRGLGVRVGPIISNG